MIKYSTLSSGTSHNGTYNSYFGESGEDNIEELPYNATSISDSPAGVNIKKVSFTPVTETEYEVLRRSANVKCLNAKAKKNPCDPASKTFFIRIYTEFLRKSTFMHGCNMK